jgi:Ion channel
MAEANRRRFLNSKHAEIIAARRFFLLFLFLLGTLLLYPLTDGNGSRYYLLRFLGSVIVVLCVYAVSFRRGLLLAAALLAVPAFLGRVILFEFDASALSVVRTLLSLGFDLFIVVVIFRRVFSHQKPNAETVFGALCIYLLVGFGFTSIYGLISSFDPLAFHLDPATNLHKIPDRFDFIYYSFGTISSLGAAGITPVSGEARSLTVIEGILGVLYLAVLISRLMGAYRTHNSEE